MLKVDTIQRFPDKQGPQLRFLGVNLADDASTISTVLRELSLPPLSRTLFVTCGTPTMLDNIFQQYNLIVKDDENMVNDRKSLLKHEIDLRGTLSRERLERNAYAHAAQYFLALGNDVVNIDPRSNLSSNTIDFLLSEVGSEFAFEIIYSNLWHQVYDTKEVLPMVMESKFSQLGIQDIKSACEICFKCYGSLVNEMKRSMELKKFYQQLSINYASHILQEHAQDGDIVLCHEDHCSPLLQTDFIPNAAKPAPLFRLP